MVQQEGGQSWRRPAVVNVSPACMYDHHHHHNNNSPPLPASLVSNLPQSHLESTLNTHHIIVSLSSPLLLMGGRGVEDIPMP
ncbi:unnamed protein product, partial [Musa hybrid cultivar]